MLDQLKRRAVLWNRRRLHRRALRRMPDYADWCRCFDTLDAATREALAQRQAALVNPPAVALLLLLDTGTLQQHQALSAALQRQMQPHWTVLAVPPPGTTPGLLQWWQTASISDPRLSLLPAAPTGDAGCRALLDAATAPWVAFIDASQLWPPHALLLLLEAAARHPQAVLVYADEDELAPDGRRQSPQFKPDWNPDLMLSHDAIGDPALWRREHLVQRQAVLAAGGPAWRHGLALRATAGVAGDRIVHVPHVLCHRVAAVPRPPTASARAVQAHLDRTGEPATAEPQTGFDGVRVRFALPQPQPSVTILIPTRNGLALLRQCVDSIRKRSTYGAYNIVVIDNGSDDPACLRWLRQMADAGHIRVRRDDSPFNFAALNNAAVQAASGEFVALVNNDIEVITPGWLEEMVSLAARPGVGAVGARLWFSDGTLQHGGVITGIGSAAGHAHKRLARHEPGMGGRAQRMQSFSAVTAACLVVRRSTYLAVGGMDADAFAVALNDVDFCLRLRAAGLRNLWTPFAELYHHESVSRGSDKQHSRMQRVAREQASLQARWGQSLLWDPAYNPNLTLKTENFALADPPRVSLLKPWFDARGAPP